MTFNPIIQDGRKVGVSVIGKDVTWQKGWSRMPEAALPVGIETLFASIVNSSDDAIYSKSLNGVILSWNVGAERLYGYSASEAIGQSMLLVVPPEKHQELENLLSRIRKGERVDHFETVRTRKDGSRIDVALTLSPVNDAQGVVSGASVIGRDITRRKQAELEIQALNRDLELRSVELSSLVAQLTDSVKELESFSYAVSHDLRAPLRHLDGFLALLYKREYSRLDDSAKHYLDCALQASQRMGRLIDDLLQFSRLGRSEIHKMPVDLNVVVDQVRNELEPEAQDRSVVWRLGTLPNVWADQSMLRQVMENLIVNALKFTRKCPAAEIEIGSQAGADGEVVIFVRDNGVGFDMRYYSKLFQVFQRLHGEQEFEGTGVGLATARRVIVRHGGRIWAEGIVGKGANFYFCLPSQGSHKEEWRNGIETNLVSVKGGMIGNQRGGRKGSQ